MPLTENEGNRSRRSLPKNVRHQIRRSNRQSVPSVRARQYNVEQSLDQRRFPGVGEDIKVKWIMEESVVWWPATVLSVDEKDNPDQKRFGKLLYHKVGNYDPIETPVLFSVTRARRPQRFVKLIDSGSSSGGSDAASWVFLDEDVEEEKGSVSSPTGCSTSFQPEETETEHKANGVDRKGQGMKTRASISSLSRIRNKHRGTLDSQISKSPRASLSVGRES